MKRIFAVLLCLVCLFCVAGCSIEEADEKNIEEVVIDFNPDPEEKKEEETVEKETLLVKSTPEELNKKFGFSFNVPAGATEVEYFIYDKTTAEMHFTLNSLAFTVRSRYAEKAIDICGIYYKWNQKELTDFEGKKGQFMSYTDESQTVNILLWYDFAAGVTYSISVSAADLTGLDIKDVARQVYVPMQK